MKCKQCGNDVDELRTVKARGRTHKVCEECADQMEEATEIDDAATGAMRDMMGYKGR